MVIEITSENDKWIRADLIDGNEPPLNLYSKAINPAFSLMSAYQDAASYVQFHFPQYKRVRIVSDLGSQTTVI